MNKIVLTGVRNIATDDKIKPQRDYGIYLIAERISEEKIDNEENCYKYRLKVSQIEALEDLNESKKVEINKEIPKTKSQIWRFIVEKELGEYDAFMDWQVVNQDRLFDEYREQTYN